MSTLVFCHDHKFYVDQSSSNIYSNGGLPHTVWKRYLNHFDRIIVIGRRSPISGDPDNFTLSSCKNVEFLLLDLFQPCGVNIMFHPRAISLIKNALKSSSHVLCRLPSTLGFYLFDQAQNLGLPVAIEVVSCPVDSFSSIYPFPVGNLLSSYYSFLLKRAAKKSLFSIYVTKTFLQERYPALPRSLTSYASNVLLPPWQARISQPVYPSRNGSFVIGMTGNYAVPYKGHEILLKAFKLLIDSGYTLKLRLLGRGDVKSLLNKVKKLSLCDYVDILSPLPSHQVIDLYLRKLHLYVQPSLTEGLPRALVEAMSIGLPCIGSRVGGIPELLPSSALVTPGNAQDLALKISELLDNPDLMGRNADASFEASRQYIKSIVEQRRSAFLHSFASS